MPRTASRLGAVVIDQSEFREEEFDGEAEQPAVEFEHGFSLEYVIQIVRPGQGPHVMEVHLKGAQLQWPYVTQMDFVWDLANAYKHYFVRDWVMPYPEVLLLSGCCCYNSICCARLYVLKFSLPTSLPVLIMICYIIADPSLAAKAVCELYVMSLSSKGAT